MRLEEIEIEAKKRYPRKGYTRDAFIAGAEWASSQSTPVGQKWIKVEDGLPEDRKVVAVYSQKLKMFGSGYYVEGLKSWHWSGIGLSRTRISHWTEMPSLNELL